jgi:hypothetical protein
MLSFEDGAGQSHRCQFLGQNEDPESVYGVTVGRVTVDPFSNCLAKREAPPATGCRRSPLINGADEPPRWRLITREPEVVGRILILHVGPDFLNLAVTDIVDEHSAVLIARGCHSAQRQTIQ